MKNNWNKLPKFWKKTNFKIIASLNKNKKKKIYQNYKAK